MPLSQPTVEIIEVQGRSEHGMTKPFLCVGDDGVHYFVKGIGANRKSQINEWIAGRLALLINLPVAPFKIVNVPNELLCGLSDEFASDLGTGPAFASMTQQIAELSYSQIQDIAPDLRADVMLFDWWISNGDRTLSELGGNPNLFWKPAEKKLVIIDHNQAFDLDLTASEFSSHVFYDSYSYLANDFMRRADRGAIMNAALESWQTIVEELPEEWLFCDPEMTVPVDFAPDKLLEHLQRCNDDDFWIWK